MALFYGVCFDESSKERAALTVVTNDCTIVNVTAASYLQTTPLGEPWRVEITATGSNPYVTITQAGGSPSLTAKRTRMAGLLGVRIVSLGGPVVYLGTAATPQMFLMPTTSGISIDLGAYANWATNVSSKTVRISIAPGDVVTMDVGRYWLSDMARVYGGPFEEWTDGGQDSGRMTETDGFQSTGYALATRKTYEIPMSVVTEVDMYAGTGITQSTYAPLKEALMFAGTHDHILVGSFTEGATGIYSANSNAYGVDALTYGRLLEIPKISRIGGPNYGCSLSFVEEK